MRRVVSMLTVEQGTTLVEMLAAAAVITILLLPTLGAATLAERLQVTGEAALERSQNLRLAAWHLARDLRFATAAALPGGDPMHLSITLPAGDVVDYALNGATLLRTATGVSQPVATNLQTVQFEVEGNAPDDDEVDGQKRVLVSVSLSAGVHQNAGRQPVTYRLRTRYYLRN